MACNLFSNLLVARTIEECLQYATHKLKIPDQKDPGVTTNLPFVGRKTQEQELTKAYRFSLSSFQTGKKEKQYYNGVVIAGNADKQFVI
jgi:hypothetical protein